jgi:hypothetical protein
LYESKLNNGGYNHHNGYNSLGSALPHFIQHLAFQFSMMYPNPLRFYRYYILDGTWLSITEALSSDETASFEQNNSFEMLKATLFQPPLFILAV